MAYNYSKIESIYIKDFCNIEGLILDFTKSPIIALVGDNEAGKTSAIEAFGVCALHKDPRGQSDHIRDNTSMFGVAIKLVDGTNIMRVKKTNGDNIYKVTKGDTLIWESSKITDGLPQAVQDAMGMLIENETKEYLQIRSYGSKLMFVNTPASANYKVMYNSLKVENLTRAIKTGNTTVNKLKQDINADSIAHDTLNVQLKGLKVFNLDDLLPLRDALIRGKRIVSSIEQAISYKANINRMNNELGLARLIIEYNLQEINVVTASKLESANKQIKTLNDAMRKWFEISSSDALETIDTTLINKVKRTLNNVYRLREVEKSSEGLIELSGLNIIDTGCILHMARCIEKIQELRKREVELSSIDVSEATDVSKTLVDTIIKAKKVIGMVASIKEMEEQRVALNAESDKITHHLTECGVAFETCSNCGSPVIIDLDKIKGAM